jgi:hypothetical protein
MNGQMFECKDGEVNAGGCMKRCLDVQVHPEEGVGGLKEK